MSILEELAKDDKQWRGMARYITGDKDKGDDLIQDFYLKVNKKKKFSIAPNYIFISLRNLYIEQMKADMNQRYLDTFIDVYSLVDVQDDVYQEQAKEEMLNELESALDGLVRDGKTFQYMTGLLKLNYGLDKNHEKLSMDKISNLTGISKRKIQTSLEKTRELLKNKLEEKYNDYINIIK